MKSELLKDIDRRAFGFRVYAARNEAHMQITELAEKTGLSEAFIRHIESGKRLPSLPAFVNLCNALHVMPNYFLSSELELQADDATQLAIDTIGTCSPKESMMIVDMLNTARKYLSDRVSTKE